MPGSPVKIHHRSEKLKMPSQKLRRMRRRHDWVVGSLSGRGSYKRMASTCGSGQIITSLSDLTPYVGLSRKFLHKGLISNT